MSDVSCNRSMVDVQVKLIELKLKRYKSEEFLKKITITAAPHRAKVTIHMDHLSGYTLIANSEITHGSYNDSLTFAKRAAKYLFTRFMNGKDKGEETVFINKIKL